MNFVNTATLLGQEVDFRQLDRVKVGLVVPTVLLDDVCGADHAQALLTSTSEAAVGLADSVMWLALGGLDIRLAGPGPCPLHNGRAIGNDVGLGVIRNGIPQLVDAGLLVQVPKLPFAAAIDESRHVENEPAALTVTHVAQFNGKLL